LTGIATDAGLGKTTLVPLRRSDVRRVAAAMAAAVVAVGG
jgi:hypothetical protein